MKSRKLTSMLLIAVLALLLAAPAAAADIGKEQADIASAFMALLDRDGIEYSDLGRDYSRNYRIEIVFPGNRRAEHAVELLIDEDGKGFSACEADLLPYDGARQAEVLRTLNSLNKRYNFVIFTADTAAHTVSAVHHGVLLGSAERAAEILYASCRCLPQIVDDLWRELSEKIPAPAEPTPTAEPVPTPGATPAPEATEPPEEKNLLADSPFPGTWLFSSIQMEADGVEGSLTLTAEDVGSDEFFLLRLFDDGTAEFDSPFAGETVSGTWDLDGDDAVLSVNGEEVSLVFTADGNSLLADFSAKSGFLLCMVRGGD